jgi:hypothetical protein
MSFPHWHSNTRAERSPRAKLGRFAAHYGLNSDIELRPKSANNGSRVFTICQKKPPEGGSSNLMIADQANAGFDLRRSGTEATCSAEYQVSPTLICGAQGTCFKTPVIP